MGEGNTQIIKIPEDVKKREEFTSFCRWCATPKELREPKEQKELAPKLGVDVSTLSIWKNYPEFDLNRRIFIREWLGDDLPAVMDVVKKYALRGNLGHIQTMLKWLGELVDTPQIAIQQNIQHNYTPSDFKQASLEYLANEYKLTTEEVERRLQG